MKTNKIYVIAAVLLVAGLLLLTGGFAMAGFNPGNLGTGGKYTEKTYETEKKLVSISVEDANTDVEIEASRDGSFHMTYRENEKNHYEITDGGGSLLIVKKSTRKWYDGFFSMDFEKKTLSLSVPADFAGSLTVKTSNNHVSVLDINASDVDIRTSNGRIDAEKIGTSGSVGFVTSNGSIDVSDGVIGGDLVCRTSNGKIILEKISCMNAEAETSNSTVSAFSFDSGGRIDLQTSNGRIEVGGIGFGTELYLRTSNGSVRGEIPGSLSGYTVSSRTSNGKNNLPESMKSGDKKITVITSNGDIDMEFSED